jgi:hypothetical protein
MNKSANFMRFCQRMRERSERQTQYKTLMRASVIFFCLAKIFLLYKYYMLVLPLPFSVLRCGAHLFVFAFSSRIPQVVPQTRFARLSIAIKVRHRGQIVSTARTVTRESWRRRRRQWASNRLFITTTPFGRHRDGRTRPSFLLE